MKLSKFQSGQYSALGAYKYQYFCPSNINQDLDIDTPVLIKQLEKASLAIGELNTMARLVPNIDLFIASFTMGEATYSSKIEGTQTNIEDAFKEKEEISAEKRDDWLEVNLYNKAINLGLKKLKTLPLSSRLIRELHGILLSSGRGKNKNPGQFRQSQNWIGGSSLQTAHYIPPHHNLLADLMTDLEMFIHNENLNIPELIRIGIIHYQFETIHPFSDGNGRMGRILIPLFLVEKKILNKPLLYISIFLESYKQSYYEKLDGVRQEGDLTGWLLFFLEGLERTAKFSLQLLEKTLTLKKQLEKVIQEKTGGRANNNLRLLEELFQNPIINSSKLKEKVNVSSPTANKMLADLCNLNILTNISKRHRNRFFIFSSYVEILYTKFDKE